MIFLVLCMLFGCSANTYHNDHTQKPEDDSSQPQKPEPPENEKVQSPLPSTDTIDWNKTISGGGFVPRVSSLPLYYTMAFNPPCVYDDYTISSDGVYFNISKPVFSCFYKEEVNESVNGFIESVSQKYLEDAQKMLSLEDDAESNLYYHKNGYGSFNVEIVGNYVNISFERMLNCYSYSKDEQGYEVYIDHVITEFTNELCCISLETGALLTIENVFYTDCDLGRLLGVAIASQLDTWDSSLKRPFRGLPAGWSNFRITNECLEIAFPQQNPYTTYGSVLKIPLWEVRDHLFIEDTDMTLIKELGSEDFEDFVSEPFTYYLKNTDLSIVTLNRDGIDIVQLLKHKAGNYATEQINVEIEKLCRSINHNVPKNTVFDYEPAINIECYAISNIVTVSLSLSYSVNGSWSINELRATFDLETGKRYKAKDIIFFSPQLYESISYVSVPIPADVSETENVAVTPYGGAIFGWDNGNASAFVEGKFMNTSIWRNIK